MHLKLEFQKARSRKIPLIALILPCVQAAWLFWACRRMDASALSQGWLYALYNYAMLNAIILPVLCSVLASRVCDTEHKARSLKLLFTLERPGSLFDAKFCYLTLNLLNAALLQTVGLVAVGALCGFSGAPPVARLAAHTLTTLLVALAEALAFQALALAQSNPFPCLAAGLIAALSGLFALFFPPWFQRLMLPAYSGLLSSIRLDWDPATRVSVFFGVPFSWPDLLTLLCATVLFFLFARRQFCRKEVLA